MEILQDSDTQRRAWLLERLGNPHLHGLEKIGIDYLKEALRIYERLGETDSAARVQVNLGHMLRGTNDLSLRDMTLALTYYRKAKSALSETRKPRLMASLHMGLSDVAWELAHADEGFEASARAMEICERLDDELLWVSAATVHAISLNSSGRQAKVFSARTSVARRPTVSTTRRRLQSLRGRSAITMLCCGTQSKARVGHGRGQSALDRLEREGSQMPSEPVPRLRSWTRRAMVSSPIRE